MTRKRKQRDDIARRLHHRRAKIRILCRMMRRRWENLDPYGKPSQILDLNDSQWKTLQNRGWDRSGAPWSMSADVRSKGYCAVPRSDNRPIGLYVKYLQRLVKQREEAGLPPAEDIAPPEYWQRRRELEELKQQQVQYGQRR